VTLETISVTGSFQEIARLEL